MNIFSNWISCNFFIGSKRSTLIHSNSMTEEPMQEYRYTVTHGSDAIRITGNNLNLVRVSFYTFGLYYQYK